MSDDPTPTDLRALIAKATPGPWYIGNACDDRISAVIQSDRSANICMFDAAYEKRYGPNQELIVAAVNALPSLLDELEQAKSDRNAWHDRAVAVDADVSRLSHQLVELRAMPVGGNRYIDINGDILTIDEFLQAYQRDIDENKRLAAELHDAKLDAEDAKARANRVGVEMRREWHKNTEDLAADRDRLAARVAELMHDPKADARPIINEWRAKAEKAWERLTAAQENNDRLAAEVERLTKEAAIWRPLADGDWMDGRIHRERLEQLKAAQEEIASLKALLREAADFTAGCHDCINLGSPELASRIVAACGEGK